MRILVRWGGGITTEIGKTGTWRCAGNPVLEAALEGMFRIRGVPDAQIAELAWRLAESLRDAALVELIDHEDKRGRASNELGSPAPERVADIVVVEPLGPPTAA